MEKSVICITCYVIPNAGKRALQFGTIIKHTWEWEIDERNLKIMNLAVFILKGYKIGGKNNSLVNIRYAAKTSDIRNFSQNIRNRNTDAYHPRVSIRKFQHCDVKTTHQSTLLVVQMSCLFPHWQSTTTPSSCYIWWCKTRRNEESWFNISQIHNRLVW